MGLRFNNTVHKRTEESTMQNQGKLIGNTRHGAVHFTRSLDFLLVRGNVSVRIPEGEARDRLYRDKVISQEQNNIRRKFWRFVNDQCGFCV
jgi:hypothetical protein